MNIFHKHKWKEIARTYAPPRGNFSGKAISFEELEILAFGVTTILWECQECHELRKKVLLGKEIEE